MKGGRPGLEAGPAAGSGDGILDAFVQRGMAESAGPRATTPWWRESYGALDLGTNNCRLLIARPTRTEFRVIDAFSRIVRLGEGLGGSGWLAEAAMERTLEALSVCANKLRRRRVTRLRAVATEACRRAANGADFLERVQDETGIALEVITPVEEARLALTGCAPLLDEGVPNALVFDIGGGSTQIGWLAADEADEKRRAGRRIPLTPRASVSVPYGVVALAERRGSGEQAYEALVAEVSEALAPFERDHRVNDLAGSGRLQMLGTSGTVTTLVGLHKGLPRYIRDRVDGEHLDFETIRALSRRIAGMTHKERAAQPCIGPERADLVVAGCAILEAICRTWPVGRLRVADRGLREGILVSLMRRAGDHP